VKHFPVILYKNGNFLHNNHKIRNNIDENKERDKKMKPFSYLKKFIIFSQPEIETNLKIPEKEYQTLYDVRNETIPFVPEISTDIQKNMLYIKKRFSVPENNDVVIRKIHLKDERRCFLIFYDGMVNTDAVNEGIIKTLQELPLLDKDFKDSIEKIPSYIIEKFVSHAQAQLAEKFEDIIEEVNFGSCGLFVDGLDVGFILDVRSWEHRSIDRPQTEQSIYGPQEAFSEMLRTNSALVRKILKTEKLICEGVKIGKVSLTRGVILYLEDVANSDLVKEVRYRINSISIDYCISSEEVAMLIEEKSYLPSNQILLTERPDRVAKALTEGRVALILNGNPHALIFPTNICELIYSASDSYLRAPYANFTMLIRLIAMEISVLLPAFYLAVTLFHQEMIPTFLLYAISASRENVPFPSVVELLLMDIAFEMIREAGIRMPNPIGSTLGIVGGLILGQAAVTAKIVSPIMIIVIALTGLGSFATADYSLSWTNRILRIYFIILASILGFYGVAIGIFIYAVTLANQNSFGIPFLSPFIKGQKTSKKSVFIPPIWKKEHKPEYLSPKKDKEQEKISMKWRKKKKK